MVKHDYILFDLDGTISKSADGIKYSLENAIKQMGKPVPDLSDYTLYIGPPLIDTFLNICHFSQEESLRGVEVYRDIYNTEGKFVNEAYDEIEELLKKNDWEMIPAVQPTHKSNMRIGTLNERVGLYWISMNTFALGPNTICVEAHETAYLEQLDKMGIEVVPVPYNDVCPFGGALHCTTLDVYREGGLEDYFPNQVPGY